MRQLESDLWVTESSLRFLGLEVGARMTVIRLADRRLLVHSPVAAAPELVREVQALGPVAYLVAPNRLHHLFVGEWQRAFPGASVYVAPGLESKRPDLQIAGVLGDAPEAGWADAVDQVSIRGIPSTNEVVFFHRPSATLIVSDLAFNVGASSPLLTRIAFRISGAYGRLSPTFLERVLVRDRAAFRRSLTRILEWPFERVIVAHGEICERGGRVALARGYSWLLGRMKPILPALLACALLALGCVHQYSVSPIAGASAPIPVASRALVVTPADGSDHRNASYDGSGSWVASALASALVGRRVDASVAPAEASMEAALSAARSADAPFLVVPAIRNWSDRLTEWSGIPDRITLRVRVLDAATGEQLDDRDVKASSRWLTFGGDHPQDLLPELADQWAASVVR
jgi:uncharacterized protein DUF4823/uncharacterized protein DUF4336